MKQRIISGVIAAVYLAVAFMHSGGYGAARTGAFVLLPLACIWFSDAMGRYTGPNLPMRPSITRATPGCIVAFGGWILLLLPVAVAWVSGLH